MKKAKTITLEHYEVGRGFILECEEIYDHKKVYGYEFWLFHKNCGIKMMIFGLPVNQLNAKEPHVYTKEECLEIALANVSSYFKSYKDEFMCN